MVILEIIITIFIIALVLLLGFFIFAPLRRVTITPFIFKKFLKDLPHISATEREALDAGDVWWEKELFCGRPDWQKMLAVPVPTLTAEEQTFLDNQIETLCEMIDDWKIVHDAGAIPENIWNYLKQQGFFGFIISKAYGGH